MSKLKNWLLKQRNTWEMGKGLSIFAFLLISAYITVTVYGIQPGPLHQVLEYTGTNGLLFWLNFIPPFLALGVLWFLTDRLFYSAAGVCFVFQIFSFINTMKIVYRDDPLVPNDIALYREAAAAASGYSLELDWMAVGIIAGSLLFFLGCGWLVKKTGLDVGVRTLVVGLLLFAMSAVHTGWYGSRDLYFSIPKSESNNMTTVFNELGFTYCFLYNFNAYPVDKPDTFEKETAELWAKESVEPVIPEQKPHIIFVMNEAFYDISNHARMASAYIDPLEHFNRIASSDRAVSGNIVVPNFGGGTANTEFDVLTGMQTNMITESGPSAFRVVRKDTVSLARLLEEQGYQSFFLHPGESWFYNRQNVYRMFGMEDQIFEDAFQPEDYKGDNMAWVKDDACADKFIEEFERRTKESDAPVFTYMVTIQNHTAYNNNKYGTFQFPWVWTPQPIEYMAQEYLAVYLEGLRDADAMLNKLTSYFDQLEEPVILAFYGDHLPNLGVDYLAYRELGMEVGKTDTVEHTLRTYSPPFVVWANEAAAGTTEFLAMKEQLQMGHEETMSANFLGSTVLQLAGFSGLDPYFDFLNETRESIPVIWKGNYLLKDGTYTNELSEELNQVVDQLHCWEYYKLKFEIVE
ncbi:MAG: LTA synthase family protein [Firmicutes bacterium]|nr:LTA synthase family protein [Bacillota bacterium]